MHPDPSFRILSHELELVLRRPAVLQDDKANKLNPANELCLSAMHDKAFDNYLFSMTDDHRLYCSDIDLKCPNARSKWTMEDTANNLISERDFVDIWGATTKPDGNLFFYSDLAAFPENRIWTVYDSDDVREDIGAHYLHWLAMPGIVPSMAIGYLVSCKHWTHETPHAIWYWDDDEYAAMERMGFPEEDCIQS